MLCLSEQGRCQNFSGSAIDREDLLKQDKRLVKGAYSSSSGLLGYASKQRNPLRTYSLMSSWPVCSHTVPSVRSHPALSDRLSARLVSNHSSKFPLAFWTHFQRENPGPPLKTSLCYGSTHREGRSPPMALKGNWVYLCCDWGSLLGFCLYSHSGRLAPCCRVSVATVDGYDIERTCMCVERLLFK